jgi:site-specific recombinase XerC
VRPHDARRATATLLLGQGVHPKLVSEMLGHANVAITLDLYSHTTPAMHREATTVLDELLAAEPVGVRSGVRQVLRRSVPNTKIGVPRKGLETYPACRRQT